MVRCDICKKDNNDDQKSCRYCGKKLSTDGDISQNTQKLSNNTIVARIYLVDNSYRSVLVDDKSTVDAVIQDIVTKMEIDDAERMKDYFGIYECLDGASIGRLMDPTDNLLQIINGWEAEPQAIAVFMIKLYVPETLASTDSNVVKLLYVQTVFNVIHSVFNVDPELAEKLAAIQVLERFKKSNPKGMHPGFLKGKLVQYIPLKLLKETPDRQWEDNILANLSKLNDPKPPIEQYMALLSSSVVFGMSIFSANQLMFSEWPPKIYIGVSKTGIHIVNDSRDKVYETYKMTDITRWGFTEGEDFYFELQSTSCGKCGDDKNVSVETKMGRSISSLLTAYAQELCKEIENEGILEEKKK